MEQGALVKVLAGKYKGFVMMVVGTDGTSVYVSDGRHRKLEKPKKLNPKHTALIEEKLGDEIAKGLENKTLTNRMLWRKLQQKVRLIEM